MVFKDFNEALIAYQSGHVHLHTRIAVQASMLGKGNFTEEQNQKLLLTTVGKLIFNNILPPSFPYINEPTQTNLEIKTPAKYFIAKGVNVKEELENRELIPPFKKGILSDIIAAVFKEFKISETSKMLDRMKDLGFKYSTRAGITVGVDDIVVLPDKEKILEEAQDRVDKIMKQDRKSTRLNSSHVAISYAVFCLKKKREQTATTRT